MLVCVLLVRSRLEWSLKPAPEHRRPPPPLGTKWNFQKPTWCFEVILILIFFTYIPYPGQENLRTTFLFGWFVSPASRDDQQPVHNRRSVGEASNAASSHPDHGSLRESQRRQAAGWPWRQRGLTPPPPPPPSNPPYD